MAGLHDITPMPSRLNVTSATRAPRRAAACGTRVTAADHNDIRVAMFHVKHPLFSNAEAGEYFIQKILDINPPDQRFKRPHSALQVLGNQLRLFRCRL